MDQPKNIAIVGANSFLATSVIAALKQHHSLHLYGRRQRADVPAAGYTLFDHPSSPLQFEELLEFDVIVYTAGAGIQSNVVTSNELIYAMNAFVPIYLLQHLQDSGYKGHLITFGSYFEIGNSPEKKFYTEHDFVHHSNLVPNNYCISKKLLTQCVFQKLPHLAFTLTHLVLPNIYGAGENAARIIPYLVAGIKAGTPLKLSSGTQQRQFVHVRDVAAAVRLVIENPRGGIYNLGGPEVVSIAELAHIVFSSVDGPKPELQLGSIVKNDVGMQFLALEYIKAEKELNWKPSIQLPQGIKEYFHYEPEKFI